MLSGEFTNNLMAIISLKKIGLYLRLMRLHQPTGIWLLLWPCWWSIAMATEKPFPDIYLLGLFAIGAIAMRSAGCIINDIIDRDIDAKVERTKNRPLASGALSVMNAAWLAVVLITFSCVILYYLNWPARIASVLFFIPVIIYPFMKRIIPWPQVFLGLTFNAGGVVGWAAAKGAIEYPALAIYAAGFFWTLGYDTIYAHQDKKYDRKIGVKSTAISMNNNTKPFVAVFYLLMIIFLMIAGSLAFPHHNLVFYGSLILALMQLLWQIKTVNLDDPRDCMRKFKSNSFFGFIIFAGILIEKTLSYN